jgi:hypothetical protein
MSGLDCLSESSSKIVYSWLHRDQGSKVKDGQILISAEELLPSRDHFSFRANFTNLPSVGWMSPNPKVFMEIRRANESGNFDLVHRTEQQGKEQDLPW